MTSAPRQVDLGNYVIDGVESRDNPVVLDVDKLIRSRLLVNANSGAGKSWTVRRLLEQTHGLVPHHILDPEGEFHGLREKFDYVLAGRPGGQKGDCPAEPKSAALLARRMLELGVSVVLDIFELDPADRIRFARAYLQALLDAPRALWRPTLVVVDEAHMFCPEKGEGDAESRDAVIGLMSKGRKRGLCGVLATQRLSKLHKSAAAEANNVLIGRTALDVDLDRAGRALGYDRAGREVLKRLRPGRFHAYGPAISDQVVVVQVGGVLTRHPEASDGVAPRPPPPPRDKVRKILAQLADLPAEAAAEARSVDELRAHVRDLERQLKAKPQPTADPAALEQAVQGAVQAAGIRAREHFQRELASTFGALERGVGDAIAHVRNLAMRPGDPPPPVTPRTFFLNERQELPRVVTAAELREGRRINARAPDTGDVTQPERKLLGALGWFLAIGIHEPQLPALAFLAGYSASSSTFANIRGSCRTKGLVTYPAPGLTAITPAGTAFADIPTTPLTDEGLQQAVLEKLDRPSRSLLAALLPHGSEGLTNQALAQATGYSASSSTFANLRGRLRTFGLVVYPSSGRTAAAALLYPATT